LDSDGFSPALGYGSEQGVRRAADRLVDQGILIRRKAGQAKLYRLNREHVAAPHVEGLAALRKQLVARLETAVAGWSRPAYFVLLFGSVARGEAGPQSDLDLLVVRDFGTDEDDPQWREQLASLERDAASWTGNGNLLISTNNDLGGEVNGRLAVFDITNIDSPLQKATVVLGAANETTTSPSWRWCAEAAPAAGSPLAKSPAPTDRGTNYR